MARFAGILSDPRAEISGSVIDFTFQGWSASDSRSVGGDSLEAKLLTDRRPEL